MKINLDYGVVFSANGNTYVRFDGGAILLSHAIERAKEANKPDVVHALEAIEPEDRS